MFNGTMYLSENSTAHAQDIQLSIWSPYCVGFGSLLHAAEADVTIEQLDSTTLLLVRTFLFFQQRVNPISK